MIKIAKMSVRSAMFDPNSVPRPNSGIPLSAEFIAMNVSGRIEIKAMTTKPTMYLGKLKLFANLAEYFVANVAPLTTRNNEKLRNKRFSIIVNS